MIQITISDDKEVAIKTTNGLKETELAANAAIEIMRQCNPAEASKYKIILTWVDLKAKLSAVKEVRDIMNLDLKEAKECIDSYVNNDKIVLATGSKREMSEIFAKFKDCDYTKVCISKC